MHRAQDCGGFDPRDTTASGMSPQAPKLGMGAPPICCQAFYSSIITSFIILHYNYLSTCWSCSLSDKFHKSKSYVCLDHDGVSGSVLGMEHLEVNALLPTHHCCAHLPACQPSVPEVWAGRALHTDITEFSLSPGPPPRTAGVGGWILQQPSCPSGG